MTQPFEQKADKAEKRGPSSSRRHSGENISQSISVSEAKEALVRSGYLLEHRVENLLRKQLWYVEANGAYEDQETKKSRELDIAAMKGMKLTAFDHEDRDWVFTTLLIECVNNPQPLAFITKEDILSDLFVDDIKVKLDPAEVFDEKENDRITVARFLKLQEIHHYCHGRVATQFCSFMRKEKGKGEWMALHQQEQFDSFMALIKAVEHRFKMFTPVEGTFLNAEFMYLVLVVQGEILDVRLKGDEILVEPTDYIKFRKSMIWDEAETGYTIDVVTENGLKTLLRDLETEARALVVKMFEHQEVLRKNIVLKPKDTQPS
jgi:hypothetical protein